MDTVWSDDVSANVRDLVSDAEPDGLNDFTPTVVTGAGATLPAVWEGPPARKRVLRTTVGGLEANVSHRLRLVNPDGNDVELESVTPR